MRLRGIILASAASLPLWIGTAVADMKGVPDGSTTFSPAESAIIARNELLRAVAATDPELVRHVLDHLKEGAAQTGSAEILVLTPPDGFDPTLNPDITVTERGSPEAHDDLLQLIKKAAADRQK